MEMKGIHNRRHSLKKKKTRLDSYFTVSELTAKLVMKKIWYWPKDKHGDQYNRSGNPEINLTYKVNLFSTTISEHFGEERIVISTNDAGTAQYPHPNNKVGPLPYTSLRN